MTFWDLLHKTVLYIWDNKQKISGTIMAILSLLQVSGEFKTIVGDSYPLYMLAISILMIIFASLGDAQPINRIPPSSRIPSVLLMFCAGLLVSVTMSGCETVGVPVAETTNEKIVFAYSAVATAADTTGILFDEGKLDREEARGVHGRLSEAKQGIDLAVKLRDAGDFSNAEARLAAIISALQILQSELDTTRNEN